MIRLVVVFFICVFTNGANGQYTWKQQKDKDGIKIFVSDVKGSSFKAVKAECTFAGTYDKLIAVLSNVGGFKNWIYHNKKSILLKQNTPYDFIYYSQTSMPWPLDDRYVILHLKINTDSLPKFLSIKGYNEPDSIPKTPGMVKVPHYKATWTVTMPSAETIHIHYILELDPGGSIPAWIANSYVDKGPYETFSNLAQQLKK